MTNPQLMWLHVFWWLRDPSPWPPALAAHSTCLRHSLSLAGPSCPGCQRSLLVNGNILYLLPACHLLFLLREIINSLGTTFL